MRWENGSLVEERSYTSRVIAESTATAEGLSAAAPTETAALEAAASLYAACFAAAKLEPDIPSLNRRGQGADRAEPDSGSGRTSTRSRYATAGPCSCRSGMRTLTRNRRTPWHGSINPASTRRAEAGTSGFWAVRCCIAGMPWIPSDRGSACRPGGGPRPPAASPLTPRNDFPRKPSGAVGRVIPLPAAMTGPGSADKLATFKTDFAGLKGRATFVPTTADGGGEGRVAAPPRDWKQERIGPAPDEKMVTLELR